MDQYKRDSTVRIGKWRWPPPKELVAAGPDGMAADDSSAEGFLEFKMRKLQERKRNSQMQEGGDSKSASPKKKRDAHASGDGEGNDSFDTSGEIQGTRNDQKCYNSFSQYYCTPTLIIFTTQIIHVFRY